MLTEKLHDRLEHVSHSMSSKSFKKLLSKHAVEKMALQECNERLKAYVQRVQALENRNKELERELKSYEEDAGFESTEDRTRLENELNDLRIRIDKMAIEKAELGCQFQRTVYNISALRKKMNGVTMLNSIRHAKRETIEKNIDNMIAEISDENEELKAAKNKGAKQQKVLDENWTMMRQATDNFDQEVIDRIRIENDIQTLEERIVFLKSLNDVNLNVSNGFTTPSMDIDLFYRQELRRIIRDIRKDLSEIALSQQNDLDEYYRIKTDELHEGFKAEESRLAEIKEQSKGIFDELTGNSEDDLKKLNLRHKDLTEENSRLRSELSELEVSSQKKEKEFGEELRVIETQFQNVDREIENMKIALRSIIGDNTNIHFEIQTYAKLLAFEEISAPDQPNERKPPVPSTKAPSSTLPFVQDTKDPGNKFVFFDQTKQRNASYVTEDKNENYDDVVLSEVDSKGNFIRITNKGNWTRNLSHWTIVRRVHGLDEIKFTLPSNSVLIQPRQSVKIFTKTSNLINMDAESYKFDDVYHWGTGTPSETLLYNELGKVASTLYQTLRQA
ncbi:hypothetical protein ACOME3_007757 [Neoechinorhynchus agilis]